MAEFVCGVDIVMAFEAAEFEVSIGFVSEAFVGEMVKV